MPYKYLICSGGGYRIVSYLGILQYMWESGELDNIKDMCGVSGGSIVIVLLAIGYTPYEIKKFFLECYTHDNDISLLDISKLYGLYTNNSDNNRLRYYIKCKTGMEDCKIRDVNRMFGIKLNISVYCLNKGKHFYAYPNWKVVDSIIASCTIPIFLTKCEIHRNIYVDPCLTCGTDICYNVFHNKNKKEVLVLQVKSNINEVKISNFVDYLQIDFYGCSVA